jgi:hypothetical protein
VLDGKQAQQKNIDEQRRGKWLNSARVNRLGNNGILHETDRVQECAEKHEVAKSTIKKGENASATSDGGLGLWVRNRTGHDNTPLNLRSFYILNIHPWLAYCVSGQSMHT